jgi:hypothetical protein
MAVRGEKRPGRSSEVAFGEIVIGHLAAVCFNWGYCRERRLWFTTPVTSI